MDWSLTVNFGFTEDVMKVQFENKSFTTASATFQANDRVEVVGCDASVEGGS